MKKALSLIVGLVLLISAVFTGCGTNAAKQQASTVATQESTQQQTQAATTDTSAANTIKLPIVTDGTTIRISVVDNWYAQAPYSQDLPVFKELEKRTGVKVTWECLPDDQYRQTIKTRIAAGGDLPDLMQFGGDAAALAKQGVAMQLDDLIKNNAPDLVNLMNEFSPLKKAMTSSDGHIYKFVQMTPGANSLNPNSPLLIRKDWVEKLGMQLPTNVDELYTVLKAFKEKDPNGNKKADEIPISVEYGGGSALGGLGSLFGVNTNWYPHATGSYELSTDGKQAMLNIEKPEFKNFVATIQKWYAEGIIDKEATKMNTDLLVQKATSNVLGSVSNYFSNGEAWSMALQKQGITNANFYGLIPFDKKDGTPGTVEYSSPTSGQWWIPAASKKADVVVKWIDYLQGTKEGFILTQFGIEGQSYTKDSSGNYHFTDYVNKNPDKLNQIQALFSIGSWPNLPTSMPTPDIKSLYVDQSAYYENDAVVKDALDRLQGHWSMPFPTLNFTQDELNELDKTIFNACDTYFNENMAKFYSGELPVSQWDGFVQKMKQMGLDRQTQIWQAALDRYNAQ